ncbi:DNA/RNA non-specific endonuclease [Ralstonia pseudosolanacearum]
MLEQTVQGGVTYQNQLVAYDTLGRLAHVEGMDGVNLEITYDKVGNKLRQTTTYNTESQRTVADYGQVLQTDESGNPVLDDAGNPVYMTEQIGSHTVYDATAHAQDQWFAYDAMNRQILVDGAANGNAGDLSNLTAGQGHILSYDKNGNRVSDESWGTAVVPEYSQNTDASGAPVGDPYLAGYTTRTGVITTWYGYDSLNRLSTVSTGAYGQQQTGTVQKVVPQVDESGNPVLDESGNPITNTVTTPVYSEVALDRSHAVTLDVRRYDGANRVVSSGPVSLPANGTGVASGTIVSSGNTGPLHASYIEALAGSNTNQSGSTATTTRYDAAGRVLSQHVVNEVDGTRSYDVSYEKTVVTGTHTVQVQTGTTPVLDESGSPTYDESGNAITTPVYGTQTITDTAQVSTYDAAGNALGYRVTQNGTTTDYTFSQALYEGYQEGGVSAVSSAGSSGSTGEQYDANGFLVGLTDSTQGANNRSFVNDANGHILQKNQQGNLLNQLVVNGQVMGTYGVGTDPNSPTNSEGNPNYTTQGNFDLGYQPVTNSYPAAATGQYPIKSGDTLESIAQSAYGDSQLWYQIAQANGLSGNADLRVGQIINIPTRVGGTHNTANTFAPYDPSKVEGSTSPNLPAPSSDDGGGCGVIGQVIMIVVAIVVTIYTAGAAAGAFGAVATGTAGTTAGAVAGTEAALGAAAGTVGGTFTTGFAAMAGGYGAAGFGAAVVGGAVGSIASQAVGNAIGAQHGFSWGQVAVSGVAAGLSAGVGAAASGTALAATQGGAGIAAGIGRAAIGSVVTQGVSVAVGLQDHFSWQQVAASAVAGGVGAAIGEVADSALAGSGLSAGVQKVVARTVSGIAANTAATVMRGGRVQIAQIVADAFGNALGESLAAASSSQSVMPQWAQSVLNGPNDPLYGTSLGIDSSYATRQSIFDTPSSSGDGTGSLYGVYGAPVQGSFGDGTATTGVFASGSTTDLRSYVAQRGDGPEAIGRALNPDQPYAAAADAMLGAGVEYSRRSNRMITQPGTEYTSDLSQYTPDQVAALDKAMRTYVSAEAGEDARRVAVAQMRAVAEEQQAQTAAQTTATMSQEDAYATYMAYGGRNSEVQGPIRYSSGASDGVSGYLDRQIQEFAGTVQGLAQTAVGAARLVSDQGWVAANALTGGLLADNSADAAAAVQRNTSLSQAIVAAPGAIASFGLRAAMGNVSLDEIGQGISTAWQSDRIDQLTAAGDFAGAQAIRTQNVLGIASLAVGGEGLIAGAAEVSGSFARTAAMGTRLAAEEFADSRTAQIAGAMIEKRLYQAGAGPVYMMPPDFTVAAPASVSNGIFLETGGGSSYYRPLDELGRPTGIDASITPDMIKTGTPADPSITPPGWAGNGTLYNQARGHLLGNQLGGFGNLPENLVTLQQNWTNSPVMRGFEGQVRRAVEAGETVQYTSTPVYGGSNLIPKGVTLMGNGSNGFNLGVTVLNPIGF